jgi:hypothetical protein
MSGKKWAGELLLLGPIYLLKKGIKLLHLKRHRKQKSSVVTSECYRGVATACKLVHRIAIGVPDGKTTT